MTETKTVCRVCGEADFRPMTDGYAMRHALWVKPSHPYQPVTIEPCPTCRGTGVAGDVTLRSCDCSMLDGKPSPFIGWRIAS